MLKPIIADTVVYKNKAGRWDAKVSITGIEVHIWGKDAMYRAKFVGDAILHKLGWETRVWQEPKKNRRLKINQLHKPAIPKRN